MPSPRVATYDLQPAMSAAGVTDELVAAIGSGRYDFIVANYANPDMVGHTGVWDATVAALEALDACLGRVVDAVDARGGGRPGGPGAVLLITADHGNADDMLDAAGNPVTKHSLNPVPLLLAGRAVAGRDLARRRPRGRRADDPRARRPAALGRDDRRARCWRRARKPAAARTSATIRHRHPPEVHPPVNPILAIGQILLSIALIAAILLQARGTGLSGTFGGDSAVYRSRRGVERRLWQFTIVLLVLFVLFALVAFVIVRARAEAAGPRTQADLPATGHNPCR